ncbi:hypothetical protein [Terrabacter terrigena]|uniref:Uncharacterized protein n=1 Tax=Terrabacter terrigena TaxID=574718 RepID=A0ABW3MZY9_9MICO
MSDLLIPFPGSRTSSCAHCNRLADHGGRHALMAPVDDWRAPWIVAYVWGEDVHAEARRRGREKITALANVRLLTVVELIADGANPDEAWARAEGDPVVVGLDGHVQTLRQWVLGDEAAPRRSGRELGDDMLPADEAVASEPPC